MSNLTTGSRQSRKVLYGEEAGEICRGCLLVPKAPLAHIEQMLTVCSSGIDICDYQANSLAH